MVGKVVFKTLTAAGFLLVGWLAISSGNSEASPAYSVLIFVGLIASFLGDILLLSKEKKIFLMGLLAFLSAHVFYSLAFLEFIRFSPTSFLYLGFLLGVGALFFLWIRSNLGRLQIPVLIYIFVINFMLYSASFPMIEKVLLNEEKWAFSENQLISFYVLGAFLFYLSDLAVARERFLVASFWNKVWGLPLYFLGQYLIAYSMFLYNQRG
jgi:uncharacterized membrane protein YhhN